MTLSLSNDNFEQYKEHYNNFVNEDSSRKTTDKEIKEWSIKNIIRRDLKSSDDFDEKYLNRNSTILYESYLKEINGGD